MISYNEIREKMIIVLDGAPYLVLSTHVFRKQQRKAVNQTVLKNLTSGGTIERTFGQSDSVEEAYIESKKIEYSFEKKGEYWFVEYNNPKVRFPLSDDLLGTKIKMIKPKMPITAKIFNPDEEDDWFEHIIDIELPIKIDLEVVEAPPNVMGNTASSGNKRVTLETGLEVNVPMFIEVGEIIRINTQTGEYVERAK